MRSTLSYVKFQDGLKKMMKKFFKDLKSDRGESLVSILFVLPLLFVMLVTMIDLSVYMLDQGQVRAASRDAARTVAIYGGNGKGSSQITPIAKAYGTIESCPGHTSAECSLLRKLDADSALIHSEVSDVACTPSIATKIGQSVHCDVKWRYKGIPGSALPIMRAIGGLNGEVNTRGTSESEVRYDGEQDLKPAN